MDPVTGQIMVKAGVSGVAVAIAGASTGAASMATLIVATGGAAALALVGYGMYRRLTQQSQRPVLIRTQERDRR